VTASGYAWTSFTAQEKGTWVRLRASQDLKKATAFFSMRNLDARSTTSDSRFDGLIRQPSSDASGGLLHARGQNKRTLGFAATTRVNGQPEATAFYEMGPDMTLRPTAEPGAIDWMKQNVAIPADSVVLDAASVIYTDEAGKRFRLPKGRRDVTPGAFGPERAVREVCTERDLLNCAGTFFELPAENAGGIAKLRPIATHNRRIHDYATWRGLLVMSGVEAHAPGGNRHIVKSTDGRAAVWVGSVDDLWAFGRPVGEGGPWKDSAVQAGVASDPYLMTGYERKKLTLSHTGSAAVRMRIEVDLTGTGHWVQYASYDVAARQPTDHVFPAGFQAYWVRVTADTVTTATAWLVYE